MKHLTMPRDDFIANVMLLGFGRSIYGDPGLQMELSPKRVITILHSTKDCTLYVRYSREAFMHPGRTKPLLGNAKKFKHDNRKALGWLVNYIDEYRRKINDPPDPF